MTDCRCCCGTRLEDFLAVGLAGLFIIATIATMWFLVKSIELVPRVLIRHPQQPWLLLSIGLFLVSLSLAFLARGTSDALNCIALACFCVVLLTAKIVEI